MRTYADQPPGTVPRARTLRRTTPESERRLRRAQREAFPRHKWRRQVPVGPYFADILCCSERLVIEVDGDTHAMTHLADAQRQALMARAAYRTLRITNADVMQNPEGVLTRISFSLREEGGAYTQHGKDEGSPPTEKGGTA